MEKERSLEDALSQIANLMIIISCNSCMSCCESWKRCSFLSFHNDQRVTNGNARQILCSFFLQRWPAHHCSTPCIEPGVTHRVPYHCSNPVHTLHTRRQWRSTWSKVSCCDLQKIHRVDEALSSTPIRCKNTEVLTFCFQASQPKNCTLGGRYFSQTKL